MSVGRGLVAFWAILLWSETPLPCTFLIKFVLNFAFRDSKANRSCFPRSSGSAGYGMPCSPFADENHLAHWLIGLVAWPRKNSIAGLWSKRSAYIIDHSRSTMSSYKYNMYVKSRNFDFHEFNWSSIPQSSNQGKGSNPRRERLNFFATFSFHSHTTYSWYIKWQKCSRMGLNGFHIRWKFSTQDNWKNENPGSHFGATS